MDTRKLYFCDGEACDSSKKSLCYRSIDGGCCRHTPDEAHAISKIDPYFPPTRFKFFPNTELSVEEFDDDAIFRKLGTDGRLIITNNVKDIM